MFENKIDKCDLQKIEMVTLPDPSELNLLMSNFKKELKVLSSKLHPIELAATVYNKFVTIHPFLDGNERTARLLK